MNQSAFTNELDRALNKCAEKFLDHKGMMTRWQLDQYLHEFDREVREVALVTLEAACMRAMHHRVSPGADILRFDSACEMKMRAARVNQARMAAEGAIQNKLAETAERRFIWRCYGVAMAAMKRAAPCPHVDSLGVPAAAGRPSKRGVK